MSIQNIKILFIAFVLLIITNKGNSQLLKGDAFLSVKGGYLSLNDYTPRNVLGFNLDIMVTHEIGIHYDFSFGKKYFHTPLAPIGGGYVMSFFLKDPGASIGGSILLGALFALIPEGVSYNANLNNNLSLSPYINPLQFDFIRNENQKKGTDSFAGGSLGFKVNLLVANSIKISPFGEYKIHYNKQTHPGFFAGISIGFKIAGDKNANDWNE